MLVTVITAAAACALALAFSESVLSLLGLHRARIGGGVWLAGVTALIVAARLLDEHSGWPPATTHWVALGLGALWTCLWFNDPRPHLGRQPAGR